MLCKEFNFLFLEQCHVVALMHQNVHIVYSELNQGVLSFDIFLIPSGFMIKKLQQTLILVISLNARVTCSVNMM
jgi:hypothetical protein